MNHASAASGIPLLKHALSTAWLTPALALGQPVISSALTPTATFRPDPLPDGRQHRSPNASREAAPGRVVLEAMSRELGRGLLGALVRNTCRAGSRRYQGWLATSATEASGHSRNRREVGSTSRPAFPHTHTRQGAFLRPRFLETSATFDEVAAVLAAMRVIPLRC